MQKSKKLMVSLCGLALSSLFVINNKSVVHADTVDANNQNNNAISWDSDSDTAQQVQNDSEQSSVQNSEKTQVAENNQQNNAETSNVESSSVQRRAVNQSTTVQSPKVSKVNDAQATAPIVINNPAGDKVNVHYVNRDGGAIADPNVKDTAIDVTKTGQGSYSVPNGYSLNNPDGKYTISGGAFNGTNLKGNIVSKSEAEEVTEKFPWQIGVYKQDNSTAASFNLVGDITGDVAKLMQNKSELGLRDAVRQAFLNKAKSLAKSYGVTWDNNFEDNSGEVHTLSDKDFANQFDKLLPVKFGNSDGEFDSQHGFIHNEHKYDLNDERSVGSLDSAFWYLDVNGGQDVQLDCVAVRPTQSTNYDWTHEKTVQYTEQQLPVAFIDANNNIVGMIQNYSGKVGTTQNVSLTVPTGYKLADGVSLPTSVTFADNDKAQLIKVVPSGKMQSITNPANNTINVKFVDQTTGQQVGTDTIDLTKAQNGTNYYNVPKGYGAANNSYQVGTTGYSWKETENLWTNTTGKTSGTFKADDGLLYTYKMFGVDPNKELKVKYASSDRDYVEANGKGYSLEDYHDALSDNLQVTASQYQKLVDFWKSFGFKPTVGYPTYFTFTPSHGLTDAYNTISGNTVTVPVHKTNSFSFADNSGNVKSVSGNNVNVILTKPQSVNPAKDTRCHSQATRTIQINFPDGQVPKSYDGIVDKSGKLVQTVHFTRTATEDALTGNILQYGSWTSDNQDHNFIGFEARTLPRIPGYTLSIKPANA